MPKPPKSMASTVSADGTVKVTCKTLNPDLPQTCKQETLLDDGTSRPGICVDDQPGVLDVQLRGAASLGLRLLGSGPPDANRSRGEVSL